MFTVSDDARLALVCAIDDGEAVLVEAATFRDGVDHEFLIEFFVLDGRVYRSQYSIGMTTTTYHEVTGDDLALFQTHYGEAGK